MTVYLICNECLWQGEPDELVALTDDLDDQDFSYCPNCGGKDLEEDDEEED